MQLGAERKNIFVVIAPFKHPGSDFWDMLWLQHVVAEEGTQQKLVLSYF